ncbi:MAG: TerB family tellurite resistance protein [Polyangiaceae bacterium]
MIKAVPNKTLKRIRDHLLAVGRQKADTSTPVEGHPLEGDDVAKALFDAVAETMFLMIASDQKIEEAERDAFRGAFRELTAGLLSTTFVEESAARFENALKTEGQAKRLDAVAAVLKTSTESAEAAFVLAAAVAFADDEIADSENEVLNDLADRLSIDEKRAGELLDELEEEAET